MLESVSPPLVDGKPVSADEIVTRAEKISPLPKALTELMQLLADPDVRVDALTKSVAKDAALTTRVIGLANSVLFRGRMEITDLNQAVARIGLRNLRDMAVAMQLLRPHKGMGEFVQDLQTRMLTSAAASRTVALHLDKGQPETAFLLGLLADAGQQMIALVLGLEYAMRLSEAEVAGFERHNAEREWLGFDHIDVGVSVAQKLEFPARIVEGIRFSHDVVGAMTFADDVTKRDVAILRLASLVVEVVDGDAPISSVSADGLKDDVAQSILKLDATVLDSLLEESRMAAFELGAVLRR